MKKQLKAEKAGLTLVEVVIAVSIFAVLIVITANFSSGIFSKDREAKTRVASTEDARRVLRRMLEELRSTQQSSTGTYNLGLTQNNALTFYYDMDNDGLRERIRYFYEAGALKKGILVPTGGPLAYVDANERVSIVANNIVNPGYDIFYYYDTNDATITPPVTPSLVRSVRAVLVFPLDPKNASTTVSFETRITLRNLKDNY